MANTKIIPRSKGQASSLLTSPSPSASDALRETLAEARSLLDEILEEDPYSPAGTILGQAILILDRLQHGIPSRRGTFTSLLRAAQLTEPISEAVEA